MLFAFGKQIAYSLRRAAECRELAVRYCAVDREYYFDREQAWLQLARNYEFLQRLDRKVAELELRVGCFSVQIACAVFTSLLGGGTQILPSRSADLPIIAVIPITPSGDAAGLG
jgi:hypothetical protein